MLCLDKFNNQMSFQELMSEIGTLIQTPDPDQIKSIIGEYATIFSSQNTGFLVILEQISPVLQNTINESDFFCSRNKCGVLFYVNGFLS